jgi:hypothetical protein
VSGLTAGNPGVGSIILLDQLDDGQGQGYPTVNDIIQCATAGSWCSNKGAGNQFARSGRSQVQVVTATAINGNNVTISPPIAYDSYRSSQSPGAWWNNSQIHNAGIEDFSVNYTSIGTINVFVKDGSNLWIKGIRSINTDSSTAESYHLWLHNAAHVTIESNYIYGKNTTCSPTFPLANYAVTTQEISDFVLDNNIFHHTNNALVPNDPGGRDVFAYNFVVNNVVGAAGAQPHGGEILMDLYEGNDWENYYGDVTHGTHNFITLFRNLFDGTSNNSSCTVDQAVTFLTNNRFNNAIGNVFGNTHYTQYEDDQNTSGSPPNSLFSLGGIGNNSGTAVTPDPNVQRTMMRWGNWDMFTSTSRTATNDLTGVRWNASEVPSGISSFSNAVPADHNLPASFYLNSAPAWFGSVPFPPIGPDVANGNAPNTSTTPSGGHANKIPARACYEGASVDPNFSSLGIKVFNANACYPLGVVTSGPTPPSNLQVVVQ